MIDELYIMYSRRRSRSLLKPLIHKLRYQFNSYLTPDGSIANIPVKSLTASSPSDIRLPLHLILLPLYTSVTIPATGYVPTTSLFSRHSTPTIYTGISSCYK
ncbi:hypothetical protein AOQ84DRAFT_107633 [Glonium stellatum]|uniref:Uncharacterized protein n=1 Tax=Glonium stellatum TaxID=574774 RepID=A0A8E2EUJ7_9PEZI|nr:hypothetical protein AOQ84DRAFT_107633 [Glonium stellatum]